MADQVGVARVPPKYSIPGLGRHDPRLGAIGKYKLPDGRLVDEATGSELARVLVDLGIPGDWHHAGRMACAEAYATHVDEIAKTAGEKAVTEFQREAFQGTRRA